MLLLWQFGNCPLIPIDGCCLYLLIRFLTVYSAVTSILINFVNMFKKSREENERLAEAEKKKLEKEAMKEKANPSLKKDNADANSNFPS